VPCSVCEVKKNCKIITTIHSDPETKLIHEYYAPVCGSACASQFFKDEEEEFDRKMTAVLENRGYKVQENPNGIWNISNVGQVERCLCTTQLTSLIQGDHPKFVNVKETSSEPSLLSAGWKSKAQGPLTVTCVDMAIHDSPKLTEPRYISQRLILELLLFIQSICNLITIFILNYAWLIDSQQNIIPHE